MTNSHKHVFILHHQLQINRANLIKRCEGVAGDGAYR